MVHEVAQDRPEMTFRMEAAPHLGKKVSFNQNMNISLGPSFVASLIIGALFAKLALLNERFPGIGKLSMFSLKAFLYLGFSCLPSSPCSPFLPSPLQPPEGLPGFDLLTWILRLDLKSSEGSLTCQS